MDIFYILIGSALTFSAGVLIIPILNRLPAKWFCDYGEPPQEKHLSPRYPLFPWGLLWGGLLGFTAIILIKNDSLVNSAVTLCALWLLLQSAMIDQKFGILPDQHTVLIAGLGVFSAIQNPACALLGALAGGGFLWVTGLIGSRINKREAIGFGDVKLMLALGLFTGPTGALFILFTASLGVILGFTITYLRKEKNTAKEQPMGPWITAAFFLWILFN